MDAPIDLVLARWAFFSAAMILFGWSLFPLYASDAAATVGGWTSRKAERFLACLALLAGIAWLLALSRQLDAARPLFETARLVLTQTSFGPDWIARLALAVVAVGCAFFNVRFGALAAAAGLLICEGWDGHASAHGWLGEATQAVHVLCAGAWIGGLFPLARLVSAALRNKREASARAPIQGYSNMAMAAVAVILLTGVVNVALTEPGVDLTGLYARVLAIKLALVLIMILFAAFNRFRLLRQIQETSPRSALALLLRTTVCEQALALAVVMAVALLGLLDPYMPHMADM
jgi:putative copper resistance protein D